MQTRLSLVLAACAATAPLLAGCETEDGEEMSPCPSDDAGDAAGLDAGDVAEGSSAETPLRPSANPTEYVAFSTEVVVTRDEFAALAGPMLGADAAAGNGHSNFVFQNGILLTSTVDGRTPEQLVLTFGMETATGDEPFSRIAAQVPASTAYGQLWFDTVMTAIDNAERKLAEDGQMEAFRIEYRTRSANGGIVTVAYDFDGTQGTFGINVQSPRTSLLLGRINAPAQAGEPYETVYGMVNFRVERDEFSFFVNRAYGISQGAAQNFSDFYLLPHEWLRLTVTPELDDERVDVAFEVVTLDGRRIPVARAPASLLGGEQFMQTVFRMYENMAEGEAGAPGTGTSWTAPFYYDDPAGGGVVEVIANGNDGVMRIAYAVESPVRVLQDVDFVPYQGTIVIPDNWDEVDPSCAEVGANEAAAGFFDVRFEASTTVRATLGEPSEIRGNVWGSVYRDEDVRITGPIDGAEAVASFAFDDVVIGAGPSEQVYRIDQQLTAGKYQILGFLDINSNSSADAPDPDTGDPVMIPIGGFELKCDVQPIIAEFALLLPEGQ